MKQINVLQVGIALCSVVSLAGALRAGDIVGAVGVPKPDHVVVYVDKASGNFAGGHAEMDQKNKMFVPYVLPVVQGAAVDFRNSDNLQHNVFGVGADEFNLGSYGLGASKVETFKGLGEVDILCNIHTEMAGYVLVLQNPYFAQPDGSGKYRIAGVPPGQYVLKAWYEGKTKKQTVQVPAHGTVTASF